MGVRPESLCVRCVEIIGAHHTARSQLVNAYIFIFVCGLQQDKKSLKLKKILICVPRWTETQKPQISKSD